MIELGFMNELVLIGKWCFVFVGDIYEDLEFWYLKLCLFEEGVEFVVVGLEVGVIYVGKNGYLCFVDIVIRDVSLVDFDVVFLFGGFMFDKFWCDFFVFDLICEFDVVKKCVVVICYGGWFVILVGVYCGVWVIGLLGIKDDFENVGVIFEDNVVVVDGYYVLSWKFDDFFKFCWVMI